MIGNSVIMELIANGTLWYYESYDHKAAIKEMRLHSPSTGTSMFNDNQYVSHEVKQNHIVWRKGKLRLLKFDPDGMIQVMYVGRSHRFAKSFIPQNVGVTLKPILNVNGDKLGLIKAGLAIDETSLKL